MIDECGPCRERSIRVAICRPVSSRFLWPYRSAYMYARTKFPPPMASREYTYVRRCVRMH